MSGSIFRSVGIVSFFSILQLAIQFALQMVLADRFGAHAEMDALGAALNVPSTLNTILTVSLGYVMIPVLSNRFMADRDCPEAWRLAMAIGNWVAIGSLLLSFSLFMGGNHWMRILCPGFDEKTQVLSSTCLKILSWQLVLGAIVSWLNAVQNARHGFAWPAIAALLGAIVNLGLAWIWMRDGIVGYAWSIIVSSIFQTGILLISEVRPMLRHWAMHHRDLQMIFYRWLPLLIGGAYVRMDPMVDRWIASYLDEGSIAHLGYAQRFIQALLSIATGGLLTVLFPKLASEDATDPSKGLGDRMRKGLQGMTLVILPILIGGSLFAEGVTRDLLERGEFTSSDTLSVGGMFRVLLLMFAGASLSDWLARGHYTLGDTRTPTWIGIFGVSCGVLGKVFLTSRYGVMAIVWSTSLYFLANTMLMSYFLSKRIGPMVDRALVGSLIRSSIASAMACGLAFGIAMLVGRYGTLIAAPVGAIFYFAVLVLIGEPLAKNSIRRSN